MAMFVLAMSYCSEAHSMHRRQASEDENYDDLQLGDEATDDEPMNDTDNSTPPVIETMPTAYEVRSGEDVILECKVNPENGTVVSWHKNNEPCFLGGNKLIESDRYFIVSNGKNLLIKNAEIEDNGIFRCMLLADDPISINHTLLVTQEPRILEIAASNEGNIIVGDDLTVTCNITASPVPSVFWSLEKNGQNERLNEKNAEFQIEDNVYSMKISNVKKENAGNYLCYAINKIGNHTAQITVSVTGKPQVHVPRTIVNSDLEIEAILQCSAHEEAWPQIRWYKDGVLIEGNAVRYVISTQGSHSNLTVTPSVDTDFGTFTCEAENIYGSHNRSIELVQSPVVEDLDVDGPRMTWTVHSHQALEEMEIQLKSTNDDGEWTTLSVPVPEDRHHKYDISYTLEDKQLQPGNYLAGVKVKNSKSWGGSNEPVVVTIQDPQSLYIQTASVFRENNAAHSIRPVYTALSTILMYLLVRMP